jgi:hypothetical protein
MGEENLEDNEVKVGKSKIGPNTIIQLNLKTLIVVLGLLGSGLVYTWRDISNKVDSSRKTSSEEINELQNEIKAIKEQDLKTISVQLNQVDGKVQGIFMNVQKDVYNPNMVSTSNLKPELVIKPTSPRPN